MSPEIYSSEKIKYLIEPVLKSYGVKNAILFGSYGRREATENSDIDILVDSGLK